MNKEKMSLSEKVNNFTSYATEFRARADNSVKQILLVSGGIQAITIGAFLNGRPPALSAESVSLLKCGWSLLSASVILCLTFLVFQTVAQWHVTLKKVKKFNSKTSKTEIVNTWPLLRYLIWIIGISGFISCITGVLIISKAAISLIAANGILN